MLDAVFLRQPVQAHVGSSQSRLDSTQTLPRQYAPFFFARLNLYCEFSLSLSPPHPSSPSPHSVVSSVAPFVAALLLFFSPSFIYLSILVVDADTADCSPRSSHSRLTRRLVICSCASRFVVGWPLSDTSLARLLDFSHPYPLLITLLLHTVTATIAPPLRAPLVPYSHSITSVRMVYALTSETSHVTHSALSLSADPPSRIV